jgi:hypothetical protein
MGSFISPEVVPDWKLTLDEFSALFHKDWVVLHEILSPEKGEGLWIIKCGVYDMRCEVFSDGVALHTDADMQRGIILAFWYRQFVPKEIELKLYCEGYELAQITEPLNERKVFEELFRSGT